MKPFNDSTTFSVSWSTHLVSVHLLVGAVRLDRLFTASNFIDKFMGLGHLSRSNRDDLVNDIVYGTPS